MEAEYSLGTLDDELGTVFGHCHHRCSPCQQIGQNIRQASEKCLQYSEHTQHVLAAHCRIDATVSSDIRRSGRTVVRLEQNWRNQCTLTSFSRHCWSD